MARAFCRALSEPYAEPADTYQINPPDEMKVPNRSAMPAQVGIHLGLLVTGAFGSCPCF
jgi:hypothetical protein